MTSQDVVFAKQPHLARNVGSSATSSTNEIVHLVPPQRLEEGKEELSDEDDSHTQHQTAGAPKDKPLPKWAQQLFDDRNPKPEVPKTSADGLRRSKIIEEQRRASEHIVNMALMAEII